MLRFSLNPTKDMSLTDLANAIISDIVSKQTNEKFLLRIEDANKQEQTEGKDKELLELLNLFSLSYEGVFHQSDNLKYHQKLTMQLMGQKNAFACFCSNEKIEELKEKAKKKNIPYMYDDFCKNLSDETVLNVNSPFIVRIKRPQRNVQSKKLKFELDSFPILNQDKTPTINYANAIDDMLFNIANIVVAKDEKTNILKQEHIRKLLNYDKNINYIYTPKIDSNYLPKTLIEEGFLPVAITNYLICLLNKAQIEIFTLEDAVLWFDTKELPSKEISFDIEELKKINKKHLTFMDNMRLSKILGFADEDIGKLAKLFLNNTSTIKELKEKINLVFAPKSTCEGFEEEFVKLKLAVSDAPFIENFIEFKQYLLDKTGLKEERVLKPLTYILTGQTKEIDISEVYTLIKNYLGEIIK